MFLAHNIADMVDEFDSAGMPPPLRRVFVLWRTGGLPHVGKTQVFGTIADNRAAECERIHGVTFGGRETAAEKPRRRLALAAGLVACLSDTGYWSSMMDGRP
jgi:hypothetical protein